MDDLPLGAIDDAMPRGRVASTASAPPGFSDGAHTGCPLTESATAMFPRVAFEYGQR